MSAHTCKQPKIRHRDSTHLRWIQLPGHRPGVVFGACFFTLLILLYPPTTHTEYNGDDKPGYQLLRVLEVAGRQGIATDGEHYYVSGNTSLYRYNKSGELLAKNESALDELPRPANHIGDISIHGGEIFAGIEWFEDGQGKHIQIAIYDARTLSYKRSIPWNPDSGQVEVSGVAIDPHNNSIWLTDWVNGRFLYRYDLTTGDYSASLHLRAPPQWQQGIAFRGGFLYITADDGDAEAQEVDNLWRVPAETRDTAAYVSREHAFHEFRQVGEIEGITFDEDAGEMIVLANRGKRIVLGMPKGLYPGYDREIHELYVYAIMGHGQEVPAD
jgi:hypothetical protein